MGVHDSSVVWNVFRNQQKQSRFPDKVLKYISVISMIYKFEVSGASSEVCLAEVSTSERHNLPPSPEFGENVYNLPTAEGNRSFQ